MLIEQTNEFELRVLRPLVIHVFLKLVIFMTKQKTPRQNHRLKYYFNAKHIAEGNVPCFH